MAAPMVALDFRRNISRRETAGKWLLAAGIVAAVAAGMSYMEVNRQLLQSKAQAAKLLEAPAISTVEESGSDRARLAAEIGYAAGIIRQLSLAWDRLFLAVESSAGKRVALLTIQPDAAKQVVLITGEARNMAAMLDCIARLRNREVLSQVVLISHEIRAQDPDKPVHFSISAKWAGAQ